MSLLDYAHSLGVAMGSRTHGRHIGWTTNADATAKLREAGARTEWVDSRDQRPEARKFDGWEVSFPVGAEWLDATR
jgi:hypothetical protein